MLVDAVQTIFEARTSVALATLGFDERVQNQEVKNAQL